LTIQVREFQKETFPCPGFSCAIEIIALILELNWANWLNAWQCDPSSQDRQYTVSEPFQKNEKMRCHRFELPSCVIGSKMSQEVYSMAYTVRSPEEKLRIVFEGTRAENISELCRREGICPKDYYRYRDKVVEGALEALRRNGRKKRDPEKESLNKEIGHLKGIIVSQAGEIELLKKKTSSDW